MTGNLTLPSKRVATVDVPEPQAFRAEFVYGFWTEDERVNDTGILSKEVLDRLTARDLDLKTQFSQTFRRFVPRSVRLTWKPVTGGNRPDLGPKTPVEKNLGKVHDETTWTGDDYATVAFQDTAIDGKVAWFIQQYLKQQARDDSDAAARPRSPTDYTKLVTQTTPQEVRGRLLATLMNTPERFGLYYQDSVTKKVKTRSRTVFNPEVLGQVRTRVQVNRKVLADLLQSATETTVSFYGDEAQTLLTRARVIQTEAVQERSSALVDGLDYDFEVLDYLSYRKVDAAAFNSVLQPVGYVIEKEEVGSDGQVVSMAPLVVENPRANATSDLKVRYGGRYRYTIKTVVLVEIAVQDTESDAVVAMSFLVASTRSPVETVTCEEFVPPPPPADFKVTWDYVQRCPRLTWALPPNPQRDIKYIQLFRRKSIKDPFDMVAMWDWDTSRVLTPPRETPDPVLVRKVNGPECYYLDTEFQQDQTWVYALCAIDAHQISSNYSLQIQVGFQRWLNKIRTGLVSVSGAPKAYPNLYLSSDTFVDTVKVSGKKVLDLYWNPEYLRVFDNEGNDLKLVRTTETGGSYRFSLVNLDLQKQQVITVQVEDRRTTQEKDVE